ncbi:MAG: 30S ribosomal protein S2 [Candidatus Shapirobacteria bacterium]
MVKTKTVNRSGKSLVKKALVIKTKQQSNITAGNIKTLNEKIKKEKEALEKKKNEKVEDKTDSVKTSSVKEDKKYNLTIGLKDLLNAGSHLGHKVSKTHPKSKDYIYTQKDGIEIFDLVQTLNSLEKACNFIYNNKRNGKQIALIGTKRQAREVVRRVATEAGVPYVTDRWLGGTITNWEQIKKNVKKLADLKEGIEKGKFVDATKKELLEMSKEIIRLEKIVGGLTGMDKMFDILFVVDAGFERTSINEATLRGIKTIAITDTDTNPLKVDFAIPANDDSLKSIVLIVEEIGKAIKAAGVKN